MWYSLWYIAMGWIVAIAAILGENIPPSMMDFMDRNYTVTSLIIAFGIVGICSRIDKLIEAQKKLKGGGVDV